MDNLKSFIHDNREMFDEDPPRGHEERFRRKLSAAGRRSLPRRMMPYLRIAGVVLLFIISTMWVLEHTGVLSRRNTENKRAFNEYQETEYYYTTRINTRLSSIEHMHFLGDSIQKKILYREFSNMDSLYLDLQKELKMNPGDERLLRAMTEYYEIKLDVLNNIISQLSSLQTKNTQSHESKTL